MKKEEIIEKLTVIFRQVFGDDTIVIREDLSAKDVKNWKSLSHMTMIAEVEESFGVKFKLREIGKLEQVGDLIALIESKTK